MLNKQYTMWTCFGLSVSTHTLLLVLVTVVGGTAFPQKCLENFEVFINNEPFICVNGILSNVKVNNLTCHSGELFYIDDFALYTPRVNDGICLSLSGFNYNQTVTAACLNKENKDLSKQIASALMSSQDNIVEAQSSLNKIVTGVHWLSVSFRCRRADVVNMCSFSSVEGIFKVFLTSFTSQVMSTETRPLSCTCSIQSSSKDIKVKPIDVRLKTTDALQSYTGSNHIGNDIFEKSNFLWSIDGPKVFQTDYLNITLTTREKWQTWNRLVIEISGDTLNLTCGPEYGSIQTTNTPLDSSQQSSAISDCMVAVVVVSIVAVSFIISTVVVCYKYRSIQKRGPAQYSNYDYLDILTNDISNYQTPEATSSAQSSRPGQSPHIQQQQAENDQQYYSSIETT
ncbi:uncharacterized protein LOC106078976 isoform X2 [Biomphalaria glabrata]|uniref:Uncharacterized protein LOC106078976 isoform X2 n=1 Tax=Biomphalaria glabrata TaxID=6526 RepID=A0A9W3ANZ9_BIOGL|nr:uncharacterized protein LOC106078976 isoform X2 [Biomphalaria glabrata]